jgi:hypothetical protein
MKFAAILLLAGMSGLAQGIADDLAFETRAFMRQTAYRNVPRLNPESAPDGAYGPVNTDWDATRAGNWYIEEQRYGPIWWAAESPLTIHPRSSGAC